MPEMGCWFQALDAETGADVSNSEPNIGSNRDYQQYHISPRIPDDSKTSVDIGSVDSNSIRNINSSSISTNISNWTL